MLKFQKIYYILIVENVTYNLINLRSLEFFHICKNIDYN